MPEVFIRTIPLPYTVHGLVTPNDDGTYNIYLNENLPEEARRRYLSHELAHISGDHLYDDRPVEELERAADKAGVIPLFRISA